MADIYDQLLAGQSGGMTEDVLPETLRRLLAADTGGVDSGDRGKDAMRDTALIAALSPVLGGAFDPGGGQTFAGLIGTSGIRELLEGPPESGSIAAELGGFETTEDVNDFLMKINPSGTFSALFGTGAAAAANEAEAAQMAAQEEALRTLLEDLAPYRRAGEAGLAGARDLATREGQQDFLTDNPMLRYMQNLAVGGNRGMDYTQGTLDELEQSLMGMGDRLVSGQMERFMPLARSGQASSAQVAEGGSELTQGFGNILAAGGMGAANAQSQGASNTATGIMALISAFSDPRLKDNAKLIGKYGELGIYKWTWNQEAEKLGLVGDAIGHMADEVQRVYPELVTEKDGYLQVLYNADGKTLRL